MAIRTARPRFGLNDDGTLYDHKTGKTHQPRGTLTDGVHTYVLAEVAAGIEKGHFDAGHYRSTTPPVATAQPPRPLPTPPPVPSAPPPQETK